MSALLLLLALQSEQEPPASVRSHPYDLEGDFGVGPELQYWLPLFRGHMREDSATSRGSDLRLTGDLHLSDEPAIPMVGGGEFDFVVRRTGNAVDSLVLNAEYWGHDWEGYAITPRPESFRGESFAAGIPVESRFELWSLTLDAEYCSRTTFIRGGIMLSLRYESATLHLDSATAHGSGASHSFSWGGGVFFDVKPVPFLFGGISLKGFTDLSHNGGGGTGAGDIRGYAGTEWGPFRLEAGYRYLNSDRSDSGDHLHYVLYGPYVAASIILRF